MNQFHSCFGMSADKTESRCSPSFLNDRHTATKELVDGCRWMNNSKCPNVSWTCTSKAAVCLKVRWWPGADPCAIAWHAPGHKHKWTGCSSCDCSPWLLKIFHPTHLFPTTWNKQGPAWGETDLTHPEMWAFAHMAWETLLRSSKE